MEGGGKMKYRNMLFTAMFLTLVLTFTFFPNGFIPLPHGLIPLH